VLPDEHRAFLFKNLVQGDRVGQGLSIFKSDQKNQKEKPKKEI
jgi:hypothetical protein